MEFLNDDKKKEIKKLTSKDIAKKYSVILQIEQNQNLKINLVSNKKDSSRFFIKEDFIFFSVYQRQILKDVRESDGWKDNINIKNFFSNLKKSGFSVYF